jgi:hypothetical protein
MSKVWPEPYKAYLADFRQIDDPNSCRRPKIATHPYFEVSRARLPDTQDVAGVATWNLPFAAAAPLFVFQAVTDH